MAKEKKGGAEKTQRVEMTEQGAKEAVLGLATRAQALDKLLATCITNDLDKAAKAVDARLKMVVALKSDIEQTFGVTEEDEDAEEVEEGGDEGDDE